jgi:hypothetical protein
MQRSCRTFYKLTRSLNNFANNPHIVSPTCPLNTAFLETLLSSTSTSLDMQGWTTSGTRIEW